MSMIVMTVITMAVIIVIVFETSVFQEIVDDRRSRAGINIGREQMIQLSPIQIVRRHALILFDIFGVRNAKRSFKLTHQEQPLHVSGRLHCTTATSTRRRVRVNQWLTEHRLEHSRSRYSVTLWQTNSGRFNQKASDV
jgi:hypothetical protein